MFKQMHRWLAIVRATLASKQCSPIAVQPTGLVRTAASVPSALQIALEALGPNSVAIADVGARWGAAAAWFRLKPLARVFGFEPDPEECARLNQLAEPGQEQFAPFALGGRDGKGTLYLTREPACSSLYPPSPEMIERYPSLRASMSPVGTLSVPLVTMANWARNASVDRLDFIKLDTQGAELEILRGAGALLDGCLGIEAEIMFHPLYVGQPLFADVDAFLRSRGFSLWRLDSQAHYTDHPSDRLAHTASVHYEKKTIIHPAGDGRLVWANAIYFRDRAQFRNSARDLLVLAAFLEAAGDRDGSRCCLDWAGQVDGWTAKRPDHFDARPANAMEVTSMT
jgi:FkbM family methyltransferase